MSSTKTTPTPSSKTIRKNDNESDHIKPRRKDRVRIKSFSNLEYIAFGDDKPGTDERMDDALATTSLSLNVPLSSLRMRRSVNKCLRNNSGRQGTPKAHGRKVKEGVATSYEKPQSPSARTRNKVTGAGLQRRSLFSSMNRSLQATLETEKRYLESDDKSRFLQYVEENSSRKDFNINALLEEVESFNASTATMPLQPSTPPPKPKDKHQRQNPQIPACHNTHQQQESQQQQHNDNAVDRVLRELNNFFFGTSSVETCDSDTRNALHKKPHATTSHASVTSLSAQTTTSSTTKPLQSHTPRQQQQQFLTTATPRKSALKFPKNKRRQTPPFHPLSRDEDRNDVNDDATSPSPTKSGGGNGNGGGGGGVVTFSDLNIREYDVALGDNPCCSSGPPVSLGWDFRDRQSLPIDVFECHRKRRRRLDELLLSDNARMYLLMKTAGYTEAEIGRSMTEVNRVKMQRTVTGVLLPVCKIEEVVEGLVDGVQSLFR